jgi:hypothetical protein
MLGSSDDGAELAITKSSAARVQWVMSRNMGGAGTTRYFIDLFNALLKSYPASSRRCLCAGAVQNHPSGPMISPAIKCEPTDGRSGPTPLPFLLLETTSAWARNQVYQTAAPSFSFDAHPAQMLRSCGDETRQVSLHDHLILWHLVVQVISLFVLPIYTTCSIMPFNELQRADTQLNVGGLWTVKPYAHL